MKELDVKKHFLRYLKNSIVETREEITRNKYRESKAELALKWFDKGSADVRKEIADCYMYLEALDNEVPAAGEDHVMDIADRKEAVTVRLKTLEHRAAMYSEEKRREKTSQLIVYKGNVQVHEKILAQSEEELLEVMEAIRLLEAE